MFHDTQNLLDSNYAQMPHIQINLKKNWSVFLNLVFSAASEEEITHLFESLCDMQKDNFNITPRLKSWFSAILLTMVQLRKLDGFYFDFDIFINYLTHEFLIKACKTKKNFPVALKKKVLTTLKMLDGFDEEQEKQNKAFLASSALLTQQITNIFLNTSSIELESNFLFFCDQLAQKYQFSKISPEANLLINILYSGKITPENKLNLDTKVKPTFEMSTSQPEEIVQEIVLSLTQKNQVKFDQAVKNYVFYYIVHEKKSYFQEGFHEPKLDNNTTLLLADEKKIIQNTDNYLSEEDKIKLFYSPYFKKLNPFYDSFMSLLLFYFNDKIFNSLVEEYKLPLNCPIKVEKEIVQTEERDDKTYKKIVKKAFYYNIVEYCADFGLLNVAEKLIKRYEVAPFKIFDKKIIENDVIYHYHYEFLKSHLIKSKNYLQLLIKYDLVDEKTSLYYKDINGEIIYDNIIFYLIHYQYYDVLEYFNSKNSFTQPQLVTSLYRENITTFLLRCILDNLDAKKNICNYGYVCQFIIEKDIAFDHQNAKNETTKNFLSAIGKINISHLNYILEKFSTVIPHEWKTDSNKYSFSYDEITPILLTSNIEESKIVWFNRAKLEQHFEKLAQQKDTGNIPLISHMLQDDNHLRKNLFIQNEGIFQKMEEEFPNFKKVVDFYKGQFRIKALTKKINIQPILLLGAPGIGKTYFAQKLAEYLATGYTFLDLGSMTAKWILSGSNGTWKDAKQGKVLDSILNSSTINPVVVLDEIDKTGGGDYDPTVVLYQLLEEINSKDFTDEFIDFSFNSSGIIYVACANDAYKLSEPLLSRFKIFEIDMPDETQLHKIIHNIYRDIIANTGIFSHQLIQPIMNLLRGKSMRDIKSIIQDAVNTAIIEIDLKEIADLKKNNLVIELQKKHFSNLYEKPNIGFTSV